MIRVPGYILTKKLGVGGMATVYLALQTSLQRQVALKVMAPAFAADRSFANRFVAEARTIAELNHPNIVAIHDVGVTDEGLHYFAMQYLPNGDLQSKIDAGIRERELIRVLLGICGALEHAHERGFVHRDVTPGNVLFDNTGIPVLTDFGIARVVTEATRMTATGLSLGTSHYMSPEQARGRRVDFRSDLYSLGAVTFEALVGRPPYEGDDSFSVAYAHVYDPVPKLPERLSRWQDFIERAMAKDPAERFQSAGEVKGALEGYLIQTSQSGRNALAPPVRSEEDPATIPLRVNRRSAGGEGRLRWLKLALGKHPREWLSGFVPAVKWGGAWVADSVSLSPPLPWLAGALALLVILTLGLTWLRSGEVPAVLAPTPVAAPTLPDPEPVPVAVDSSPEQEPEPAADTLSAGEALAEVSSFEPDDPALVDLENGEVLGGASQAEDVLTRQFRERILELVADANRDLSQNRLTTPADENALEKFEKILSLDADNIQALDGIGRIVLRYVALARTDIRRGRFDQVQLYQRRGAEVAESHGLLARYQDDLASITELGYQVAADHGREAEARGAAEEAGQAYRQALLFRPGDPVISEALDRLENPVPPGPVLITDSLGDGGPGPEMVVVEIDGRELAVGATEITVDLYRKFVATGAGDDGRRPACRHLESMWRASRRRTWENPGFDQSGRHPVVCVSWQDAAAFAAWLSAETSHRYRLPSESEWRSLAAAENPAQSCGANLGDAALAREISGREVLKCDDGWSFTAPVGSYQGTSTGLFDFAGNVREWVADCTKQGRSGACKERRVMGGAWMDGEGEDPAAIGNSFDEDHPFTTVGFRLVRDM